MVKRMIKSFVGKMGYEIKKSHPPSFVAKNATDNVEEQENGCRVTMQTGNELDISPTAKLQNSRINVANGTNNRIVIGEHCALTNCNFNIYGSNNLISLSPKGVYINTGFVTEDDGNEIRVGEGSTLYGETELAAIEGTRIVIGNDCMFSSYIHFRTGDSHGIVDLDGNRINLSEDIVIGNHVWIGTRVICLKGVIVPDNCVIGAGALLSKKFTEANAVYAGVPAGLIKANVNWTRERK